MAPLRAGAVQPARPRSAAALATKPHLQSLPARQPSALPPTVLHALLPSCGHSTQQPHSPTPWARGDSQALLSLAADLEGHPSPQL